MKIRLVRQTRLRTISYLYNDRGQPVGRSDDRHLVGGEELHVKADEFVSEHPEMFKEEERNRALRRHNARKAEG